MVNKTDDKCDMQVGLGKIFTTPRYRKPFTVVLVLMALQQLSGIVSRSVPPDQTLIGYFAELCSRLQHSHIRGKRASYVQIRSLFLFSFLLY